MPLEESTVAVMRDFAALCRNGKKTSLPGATDERLQVYRSLVWEIIAGTCGRAYPLTKKALTESEWQNLISLFFAHVAIPDPALWKMPKSLLDFAVAKRLDEKFQKPFLLDLLRFEWAEIEVQMMPDRNEREVAATGDLLRSHLLVNEEHLLLHLRYPVHKTKPEELSLVPKGDYRVLVYRHPETLAVIFLEFSPYFATLFERIHRFGITGQEAIRWTQDSLCDDPSPSPLTEGLAFLQFLCDEKVILGFER